MGNIAYYVKDDKTKLYLNIVERYNCPNDCIFCDKKALEESVGTRLFLEKKPNSAEIVREVYGELQKNTPKEIIFCGIGEPLAYLRDVIDVIKNVKRRYAIPFRVNTNGQVYVIHPGVRAASELKEAGLDKISISINAFTKEEYNQLHRPKNVDMAFPNVLKFTRDCIEAGIETWISFIDFKPGKFDTNKLEKFVEEQRLQKAKVTIRELVR